MKLTYVNRGCCRLPIAAAFGILATLSWESRLRGDEVHPSASNGSGGTVGAFANATIDVNGQERVYRLVVPESIDPETPVALVFAFHGLLDSKDIMPRYTRLDDLAKKEAFVLVYPNGRNRHWPLVLERTWKSKDSSTSGRTRWT